MITEERAEQCAQVREAVRAWAAREQRIVAAAVVGSWARSAARMSSDLDIVVLTSDKAPYVADDGWIRDVLGPAAALARTKEWGVVTERRVRLRGGFEVDLGFAEPAWAATDPVDPGTAAVVLDGCDPLVDPEGVLARLIKAVADAPRADPPSLAQEGPGREGQPKR